MRLRSSSRTNGFKYSSRNRRRSSFVLSLEPDCRLLVMVQKVHRPAVEQTAPPVAASRRFSDLVGREHLTVRGADQPKGAIRFLSLTGERLPRLQAELDDQRFDVALGLRPGRDQLVEAVITG